MAKVTFSGGIAGLSGTTGNAVFARTQHGTVLRSRPSHFGTRTAAQNESSRNLALVNRAWRELNEAEVQAWRIYAFEQATTDPATGQTITPSAPNLFTKLGTKFLQVNPDAPLPTAPPTGNFFGDLVQVVPTASIKNLIITASQPNAPGVVTEVLVQKLTNPNNQTRPKSYTSAKIISFTQAQQELEIEKYPGTYAVATRFIETNTGRMTRLVEVGRATVG